MLCFISLIFIISIVASLEADSITLGQAIWCEIYAVIVFYNASKPYWWKGD